MTKTIPLNKGLVTVVDDEDYDLYSGLNWYAHNGKRKLYVVRKTKGNYIHLHRLILDAPDGFQVDHINGDTLNNTRSNLRLATPSQNQFNRLVPKADNASSAYRGVSWDAARKRWLVRLIVDGRVAYRATSKDEVDAAHLYDTAARHYCGEFAWLNFPEGGPENRYEPTAPRHCQDHGPFDDGLCPVCYPALPALNAALERLHEAEKSLPSAMDFANQSVRQAIKLCIEARRHLLQIDATFDGEAA